MSQIIIMMSQVTIMLSQVLFLERVGSRLLWCEHSPHLTSGQTWLHSHFSFVIENPTILQLMDLLCSGYEKVKVVKIQFNDRQCPWNDRQYPWNDRKSYTPETTAPGSVLSLGVRRMTWCWLMVIFKVKAKFIGWVYCLSDPRHF